MRKAGPWGTAICAALFLGYPADRGATKASGLNREASVSPLRQEPHVLTAEVRKTVTLRYLLSLPRGYGDDPERRWPVILFLHGSGERGTALAKVKAYGPAKLASEGTDLPFIVLAPQAPERTTWDPDALDALLSEVATRYAVDEERIYLTGASMGGSGTWRLAAAHPERFAAIAPICGTGNPAQAEALAHIPAWVFHGGKDDQVPLQASEEMVTALKQVGGEVAFTIHPDAGHDAWTETYNNPALYEWLLAHKRQAALR